MNEQNNGLPSEAILKILSEALAVRMNEFLLEECLDIIHECTTDVVTEQLGSGVNQDALMAIAMELSGRVTVVAV